MAKQVHCLQPAVQVAQSKEDSAARAVADMQHRLAQQQAYLQQLLDFRSEYSAQLQAAGQSGIAAQRFQGYRVFLGKLDRSIAQCQQNLLRIQNEFHRKRHLWLMSHAKTQALAGVIERDRRERERAEDRREQADSDERNLLKRQPISED